MKVDTPRVETNGNQIDAPTSQLSGQSPHLGSFSVVESVEGMGGWKSMALSRRGGGRSDFDHRSLSPDRCHQVNLAAAYFDVASEDGGTLSGQVVGRDLFRLSALVSRPGIGPPTVHLHGWCLYQPGGTESTEPNRPTGQMRRTASPMTSSMGMAPKRRLS